MTCEHVRQIRRVQPHTQVGCEECLREGSAWVSLRMCLVCGHVGCCDQSPGRHARAHFEARRHPVARSFEPGEGWGYCYVHELRLPAEEVALAQEQEPERYNPSW